MNPLLISMEFVAGGITAVIYFGGLWWTCNRLPKSNSPVSFYLASLAVRFAMVVVCVAFMLQLGAVPFIAAASGFFVVRILLITFSAWSNPTSVSTTDIRNGAN